MVNAQYICHRTHIYSDLRSHGGAHTYSFPVSLNKPLGIPFTSTVPALLLLLVGRLPFSLGQPRRPVVFASYSISACTIHDDGGKHGESDCRRVPAIFGVKDGAQLNGNIVR